MSITERSMAKDLGERLQQAMREADVDRPQLSRLTGYPEHHIENWEQGRAVMYLSELVMLCNTLDITPHQLLGWQQ